MWGGNGTRQGQPIHRLAGPRLRILLSKARGLGGDRLTIDIAEAEAALRLFGRVEKSATVLQVCMSVLLSDEMRYSSPSDVTGTPMSCDETPPGRGSTSFVALPFCHVFGRPTSCHWYWAAQFSMYHHLTNTPSAYDTYMYRKRMFVDAVQTHRIARAKARTRVIVSFRSIAPPSG